uniref:Uncharacterized protein n=1 Tax=Anguilla anguilla TaxID=7936 RepID=A0A0E9S4R9_ANGAN
MVSNFDLILKTIVTQSKSHL